MKFFLIVIKIWKWEHFLKLGANFEILKQKKHEKEKTKEQRKEKKTEKGKKRKGAIEEIDKRVHEPPRKFPKPEKKAGKHLEDS